MISGSQGTLPIGSVALIRLERLRGYEDALPQMIRPLAAARTVTSLRFSEGPRIEASRHIRAPSIQIIARPWR